jgi:hypothetical protein
MIMGMIRNPTHLVFLIDIPSLYNFFHHFR